MALEPAGLEWMNKNLPGFVNDIGRANRAMTDVGDSADRASGGFSLLDSVVIGAAMALTTFALDAAVKAGRAIIGLSTASVKLAADFQSMGTTMEIAGGQYADQAEAVGGFSEIALQVGGDTRLMGVSATGAAGAMTGLMRAGLSLEDVMGDVNAYMADGEQLGGALRASIDLAAASDLDMVEASELAVIAMSTFGIEAGDITAAMDHMVRSADASVAEVGEMAEAIAYAGPVASGFGMEIEDMNTVIALFSQAGIRGSRAGTTLESMLRDLRKTTPKAKKAMDKLGVSIYDTEGATLPLVDILAQFEVALDGMTDAQRDAALAGIFQAQGLRGITKLMDMGTEGWMEMTEAIGGATSMTDMATKRSETYAGQMEALEGVLETLKIRIGTALLPALTDIIGIFSELIEEYGPYITSVFERIGEGLKEMTKWFKIGLESEGGLELGLRNLLSVFLDQIGLSEGVIDTIFSIVNAFDRMMMVLYRVGKAFLLGLNIGGLKAGLQTAVGTFLALVGVSQETTEGVTDAIGKIYSVFQSLVSFLIANVPKAVSFLGTIWREVLVPAFGILKTIWDAVLLPVLTQLIAWFQTYIPKAVASLSYYWTNYLMPAFATLQEMWQSDVKPALSELMEALGEVWQSLKEAWTIIKEAMSEITAAFVEGFGGGERASIDFIDVIKVVTKFLTRSLKGWAMFFGRVAKGIKVMVAVGSILWLKYGKKILAFTKVLGKVLKAVGKFTRKVIGFFIKMAKAIVGASIIPDMMKKMENIIVGTLESIERVIKNILNAITNIFKKALNAWYKGVKDIFNDILKLIGSDLSTLEGKIETGLDSIEAIWSKAWDAVEKAVREAWDDIEKAVRDGLGDILSRLSAAVSDMIRKGRDLALGVRDGLVAEWSSILRAIADGLSDIVKKISDKLSDMVASGRRIAEGIRDGISYYWYLVTAQISAGISALGQRIRDLGTTIGNWGYIIVTKIRDGIAWFWYEIKNKISSLVSGLKDIVNWDAIRDAGARIVDALIRGVSDNWWRFVSWLLGAIGGIFGSSEPTDPRSPFRTARLRESGKWIGQTILESIQSGFQAALPAFQLALAQPAPLAAAPVMIPQMGAAGRTVNLSFGPTYIGTDMDQAVFEARVKQIVADEVS